MRCFWNWFLFDIVYLLVLYIYIYIRKEINLPFIHFFNLIYCVAKDHLSSKKPGVSSSKYS